MVPEETDSKEAGPEVMACRCGFTEITKPWSGDVIAFATVREQARVAQERWAQACIRIKISISNFRIPAGSTDATGRFIMFNPGEANTRLMGDGGVSVIGASFPSTENITVYFVPPFGPVPEAPPGTIVQAVAWFPSVQGRAEVFEGLLRPGMPVRLGATQAVANTIFVAASRRGNLAPLPTPFLLSHEIGHILANIEDTAQLSQVLFPRGAFIPGTDAENTVVGGKRLPDQRDGDPRLGVIKRLTERAILIMGELRVVDIFRRFDSIVRLSKQKRDPEKIFEFGNLLLRSE